MQMATGDLRGNLVRLRLQLLSINYPHPFDVQGLKQGIPAVVLPLLHYALLGYSRHVARYLSARGYELYAKSDLRFMESALRFFREEFNYRCALTIAQLFSRGYAERKMIFIHDAIQMSKRKHTELVKLGREKTIEKAELTQINYDTMPGCGHGISNLKHPRACEVQSIDHFLVRKMKPWEHTLRTSKNSVRCSKDQGCAHVDITVLPGSEPISPRHRRTDSFAEHHQSGMPTPKGSNTQTWESPIGTRAKSSSAKVQKRVTYQEDLTDVPTRSSNEFSAEDQSHQEICQRIMDMAEKLEARFSTLEAGVTRAKESLQEKLVSLEGRVRNLENVKQEQKLANSRELSRRNCKEQSAACTPGDLSQRKNVAYASSCTTGEQKQHDPNELCEVSTCKTVDMLRPKCNEHAWSLHQNFQDSHHFEPVTGVPASQLLNSQAIRDISNTHQCVVKNLTDHAIGTSQDTFCEEGYKSVNQQEPVTSTRDFIAGVRARFNRTLEVLLRNAFRLRRFKRLKSCSVKKHRLSTQQHILARLQIISNDYLSKRFCRQAVYVHESLSCLANVMLKSNTLEMDETFVLFLHVISFPAAESIQVTFTKSARLTFNAISLLSTMKLRYGAN